MTMRKILSDGSPSNDFRMLLAYKNFLDCHAESIKYDCKSKKQYITFTDSLITYLLQNHFERDKFLEYGGHIDCKVDKEHKIIKLIER